jgi:hypothetical protein
MALTPEQQALDYNPELQDVSRQRKLAELLMAQGMQQPQGQMISGHYVAPSWSQQMNPIANILAGQAIGGRADTEQVKIAEALRTQKGEAISKFQTLMSNPATRGEAMKFAASNQYLQPMVAELMKPQKLGEGENLVMPNMGGGEPVNLAAGGTKYHAPLQIDTGTMIEIRDPRDPTKVIARMPKSQMPQAGQVVETANGPMLVNTRTGQASPVMGAGGQAIAPKLTSEQSKDITSINQQYATIDGALQAVKSTPTAFSFGRGAAQNLPAGESLAGRLDKPEEVQARAYVFNNVSAVIKERAGTAQSPSELQRINSFMPAVTDNAKQIENKLNGFKTYLSDLEKGTRKNPNMPTQQQAPQGQQAPQIDPKLLQYMTPEQRKLFGG